MRFFRSLIIFVILALLFTFQSDVFSASPRPDGEPTEEEMYSVYADIYYLKREINHSIEMSVREAFLKWLYDGIVDEVLKRKKSNPDLTLEALNPTELKGYGKDSYSLPENIDEAPPQIYFPAYEKYERDEYNHKYLQARLIKDKLISTASPEQRQRMFNNDLKSTILNYRDGQYTEAVLKFDELIKEYGFRNFDDIFFYRGESYFALNLEKIAIRDFEAVISSETVDPLYNKKALHRLISLYGDMGELEKVIEYWSRFQENYSQNYDDEYWQVLELVARYLMISGDLSEAITLFDQIPQTNVLFIQSQLYAAESALMKLDLDDAEIRFSLLTASKYGKLKINKDIRNQARLKIGYVYFLRGEFSVAFSNFNEVEGDDKLKEVALISSAWSAYRLNAFKHVITICSSFMRRFPNSEYQYEGAALMGHCREIIGQDTLAVDLFEEIMAAVDDRQEYRDFIYENRQISKISSDLILIEDEVFGQNRPELFKKFLSVRKKLNSLKQKTRLAEGFKSNPELEGMIVEQATLIDIISGQQELEAALDSAADRKSQSRYESILTKLSDLTYQVSGGIRYELSRTNLTQREEKQRFESILSDSLELSTLQEIKSIDILLEKVREMKSAVTRTISPELMIDLTALGDDLQIMRKKLLNVQSGLSGNGDVETTSNLDEWSDFAYLRYTYGGLDFDNFTAQQERLTELDGYIQQLSRILADRNRVDDDATHLAPALILASEPGEEPHRAPPVPLWGEIVKAAPAVQSTSAVEAVSDTTLGDQAIDAEGDGSSDSEDDEEMIGEGDKVQPEDKAEPSPLDGEPSSEGESGASQEGDVDSDQSSDEPPVSDDGADSDLEEGSEQDETITPSDEVDEESPDMPVESTLDISTTPAEESTTEPDSDAQPGKSGAAQEDDIPVEKIDLPDAETSENKEGEQSPKALGEISEDEAAEELTPEKKESTDPEDEVPPVEPEQDPNKKEPSRP